MPKSKQAEPLVVLPPTDPLNDRDVANIAGALLSGATAHWGAWTTETIVKAVSLARQVVDEVNRTSVPPEVP